MRPVPADAEASVIVLFGGVQADAPGAPVSRFPESQIMDVSGRVRSLLSALRPRLLVGAAASGSDLVILEQALALGLKPHIVLPFSVPRFRQTSVESRGPAWVRRYDIVLAQVGQGRAVLEVLGEPEDDDVYTRTNGRLLARAEELRLDGEEIITILLRPAGPDGRSVTDDLGARAESAGLLVLDLDCRRRLADRRSAFVAMPYGKKLDPQTGLEIDCDAVFDRVYVPVLEDLDYRWQRSDRETDTGVIHVGMVEAIANSDLVIADLTALNPNVLYELGLRHALADKVTVLTAPDLGDGGGTRSAFDIDFIRRVPYHRSAEGLTDRQAVQAIGALRTMLAGAAEAARAVDSPVFLWFDIARADLRARAAATPAAQLELRLRQKVAAARSQAAPADLIELAGQVDDAAVAPSARQAMRLDLAIALREQGAYADAVGLLGGVPAPEGPSPLRTLWLQAHALALRRLGEQEQEAARADELWARAERLLSELLAGERPGAETCGIAAGLAKRRFARFLAAGRRALADAQLARMISLYRTGYEGEPWDYYVGINLVASLRLRGQRFPHSGAAEDLAEARETLPVVRLMVRRLPPSMRTFWASVTGAELALHEYLLDHPDAGQPADQIVRAYAEALALEYPPDYEKSAYDQLEIFRRAGDPWQVIDAVQAVFPDRAAPAR
jgi:hypothetical protein